MLVDESLAPNAHVLFSYWTNGGIDKYVGCFNASTSSTDVSTGLGPLSYAIDNSNSVSFNSSLGYTSAGFQRLRCAELCWTRSISSTSRYNYNYFGVNPGSTANCYCGNAPQTAKVDPAICWGQSRRKCNPTTDPNSSCGGINGAILFARTDVVGTCTSNTTATDHACFQVNNVDRTEDPGCDANAASCSHAATTTTSTTTTTVSSSFQPSLKLWTFNDPTDRDLSRRRLR